MRDERLHYQRWVHRHTPSVGALSHQRTAAHRLAHRPLISVITPVYNTPPDFLRRVLASVRHQTYPFWEHCLVDDGSTEPWLARRLEQEAARDPRIRFRRREANGGIVDASNDALALATGEFLAFLDHDDEIEPDALYEVALAVNARPDTDVFYSDFDLISQQGHRHAPAFWPAWSPERLECLPYTVHLRAYRRSVVAAAGGLRAGFDGAQDYDLALRVREVTDRIIHIPRVLYHWRISRTSAASDPSVKPYAYDAGIRSLNEYIERQHIPAVRAPGPDIGMHALRFDRAALPPVSIVAALAPDAEPHAGRTADSLAASLSSLLAATAPAAHEAVVVVSRAQHDATRSSLDRLPEGRVRIVPVQDGLSYTAALNAGARQATGDLLLLLGEDLEPSGDTWLEQLAGYAQRLPIGAVGPKIASPGGDIVHAGIVLPRRRPHPAHRGKPATSHGYYWDLSMATNYSAASGACLMTRRALFEEVGGFRAEADVGYGDVDYCLRLRERGYRIVVSGYAELRQIQAPPPVPDDEEQARLAAFRRAWPSLPEVDPYYNPNFDQDSGSFRLADD